MDLPVAASVRVREDGFGFHLDQVVVADQGVDVEQRVGRPDVTEVAPVYAANGFPVGVRREVDAGAHDIF